MKTSTIIIILLSLIAFILLLSTLQTLKEVDLLKDTNDKLVLETNAQSNKIDQLQNKNAELITSLAVLEDNFIELNDSYQRLSKLYSLVTVEVDDTLDKIDTYKKELEESMAWFKDNSDISTVDDGKRIKDYLYDLCLKTTFDECYIKTACIFFINYRKFDYVYKNDTETTGQEDQLLSLRDFEENGGGDCEDYSLFFKAQYNYLLDYCQERNYKIYIEAFVHDITGDKYYVEYNHNWFYPHAKEVMLNKTYPVVVCGVMSDTEGVGHCTIAYTESKINDVNDISKLDGAPMVEPQTGEYTGIIDSDIFLLEEGDSYSTYDYFINLVITDTDTLWYSQYDKKWISYEYFEKKLIDQEHRLISIE